MKLRRVIFQIFTVPTNVYLQQNFNFIIVEKAKKYLKLITPYSIIGQFQVLML